MKVHERPPAPMTGVRRGRLAVGGLALLLVTAGMIAAGPTASARVAAVQDVVTVHIRDNTFVPASLNVAAGTTVRWVNDGRNTHNVTPEHRGARFGSGNLKPGRSYVRTFADAGTFAYYCTLHGTPTSGQHAELAVGDAAAATPVPPVGGGDARPPAVRGVGPHHPRSRPTPRRSRPGVDRAKAGDLVLVSPGVYQESVDRSRTDGIVLRGVDRNRTILDGEFKRDNGVFVVGADGVAVENLTARNYTENGFFWNGVARLPRLVPHRVPQRRLRHLRVRLAVRAVRPLVRVGQPRLRLLHRAVQPVSRGHHRCRVRVQPARLLGHELVG